MLTTTNTHAARRSTLVRTLAIFAAAATCGAVVANAAPAQAARALVGAAACYIETDYDGDYRFVNSAAIANASGSRARKLFCPIPTTDANPRSSISQFWISGIDSSNEPPGVPDADGRVLAEICMRDDWAGGTACSNVVPVTNNTATGLYDTNIATFTGTSDPVPVLKSAGLANWYPTLVVSLPRNGINGWSAYHGFTTL